MLEVLRLGDRLRLRWNNKPIINFTDDDVEEMLFWSDLYAYPDLVSGDPRVVYIHDTRENKLYWGRIGNIEFQESSLTPEEFFGEEAI